MQIMPTNQKAFCKRFPMGFFFVCQNVYMNIWILLTWLSFKKSTSLFKAKLAIAKGLVEKNTKQMDYSIHTSKVYREILYPGDTFYSDSGTPLSK